MTRTLRGLAWAAALLAAAVVAYGLGILLHPAPPLAGQALERGPDVGSLRLVDGSGEPVRLSDFQGRTLLVYFGFTRCADTCPLTMQRLAKAYRDAGSPADLQVVMITVDPAHDTPAVLDRWVKRFDPSFVGLTGSYRQVAAAAERFMIGYAPDANGEPVDHTAVVEVVGPRSRVRYVYGQGSIVKLGDDLPRLLAKRRT